VKDRMRDASLHLQSYTIDADSNGSTVPRPRTKLYLWNANASPVSVCVIDYLIVETRNKLEINSILAGDE
jgi:hypothetical protein